MKIVTLVMVWRRPEIVQACYSALDALELPAGWDLEVLVVGSEGAMSALPAAERGHRYASSPNLPLGEKANAGLRAASELSWDFLLHIGSDTLLSPRWLDLYLPALERGAEWIGCRDLYLYDTENAGYYLFQGYPGRGGSIGAGRLLSRRLLARTGWALWGCGLNRGLDLSAAGRLRRLGASELTFSQQGAPSALVELKSEVNINPIRDFAPKALKRLWAPPAPVLRLVSENYHGPPQAL